MSCPTDEAWLSVELGEITINTRAAMLKHELGCSTCRSVHERQQQLLSDLAAPPNFESSADDFVTKVMERCESGASSPRRTERRRLRILPWTAGLLAVAAAIAFAFIPAKDELNGEFQARGGRAQTSGRAAAADVFLARGKTLERLGDAVLHAGDRLAVRVVNQTEEKAYFMAFVVDALGDVHWLFPAYIDEKDDPQAVELAAGENARVLPEMVELVEPAEGKLRVVSMLSTRRMRVKEVEARIASLPQATLERVFPESRVREWSCEWRTR